MQGPEAGQRRGSRATSQTAGATATEHEADDVRDVLALTTEERFHARSLIEGKRVAPGGMRELVRDGGSAGVCVSTGVLTDDASIAHGEGVAVRVLDTDHRGAFSQILGEVDDSGRPAGMLFDVFDPGPLLARTGQSQLRQLTAAGMLKATTTTSHNGAISQPASESPSLDHCSGHPIHLLPPVATHRPADEMTGSATTGSSTPGATLHGRYLGS